MELAPGFALPAAAVRRLAPWAGRPAWSALWALLTLVALLAACSEAEPWRAVGNTCVRASEEGPLRRVINRVDPELCGRYQKHRSPVYVRIQPPSQEEPR
jgi:hypothetical protein